jgi:hypothetical protein
MLGVDWPGRDLRGRHQFHYSARPVTVDQPLAVHPLAFFQGGTGRVSAFA